ncbi:MAG: nitrilase-related carbon-nitrogen hydrolase [Fimbriimonas sp.]|nr:nitrilase-related carbon-nitrogen hydrolase [Fimbriimonas sp.]
MNMRLATAAWKIRPARRDSSYFAHFYDLVSEAHDEGASVLVVPELHVLELLPIVPDLSIRNVAKYLAQYAEAVESWIKRISDSSGMIIVGGSHFKETPDGIKNVCAIGVPGRELTFNEKNKLTVYERQVWDIQEGAGLAALPNHLGVTVCYDCEFPESGRALAEAGTLVQCVPSWTETKRGFQRVRWCCQARAVENQVFVVQSSLVGELGYEPVPHTYGSAAIIAPSVEPFPVNPILRETAVNEEGVVYADLDLELISEARSSGEVANWKDRSASSWELIGGPAEPYQPWSPDQPVDPLS